MRATEPTARFAALARASAVAVIALLAFAGSAAASGNAGFTGVPDPTQLPYRAVGELDVRFEFGLEGRCTASAIDSPSRRLVLTAAHCLYGQICPVCRPLLPKRIAFVPAYAHHRAPFGSFAGVRWYVPSEWRRRENKDYDFAAVLTAPNAAGEAVADAVGGGLKVSLDGPRSQTYRLLGYPGKSQQQMHQCEGAFAGEDPLSFSLPGPPTTRVRCSMRHGASGGPWLVEGGTAIGGLTSYFYENRWSYTYGPYFASRTIGAFLSGL